MVDVIATTDLLESKCRVLIKLTIGILCGVVHLEDRTFVAQHNLYICVRGLHCIGSRGYVIKFETSKGITHELPQVGVRLHSTLCVVVCVRVSYVLHCNVTLIRVNGILGFVTMHVESHYRSACNLSTIAEGEIDAYITHGDVDGRISGYRTGRFRQAYKVIMEALGRVSIADNAFHGVLPEHGSTIHHTIGDIGSCFHLSFYNVPGRAAVCTTVPADNRTTHTITIAVSFRVHYFIAVLDFKLAATK